jgi:hypothetical protein
VLELQTLTALFSSVETRFVFQQAQCSSRNLGIQLSCGKHPLSGFILSSLQIFF